MALHEKTGKKIKVIKIFRSKKASKTDECNFFVAYFLTFSHLKKNDNTKKIIERTFTLRKLIKHNIIFFSPKIKQKDEDIKSRNLKK